MEHLNKLSFRVPLLPLSLKSPSNNDGGPGRLSSAEPLASVFSEDLVKVMMILDKTTFLRVVLK